MIPSMTTSEALCHLAEGHIRQVCLVKPGHFGVLVTYDIEAQEFVFAKPWRLRQGRWLRKNRPISIIEILFQTTPRVFDFLAIA